MHPVTDEPWHFDLYRVDEHQQIKIEVPVHFSNQDASPGLKRGATLGVILHTVTVACHADSIPEEIVVDLTASTSATRSASADLKLPAKVEAAMDAELVVASIAMSRSGTEDAEGEGPRAKAARPSPRPPARSGGQPCCSSPAWGTPGPPTRRTATTSASWPWTRSRAAGLLRGAFAFPCAGVRGRDRHAGRSGPHADPEAPGLLQRERPRGRRGVEVLKMDPAELVVFYDEIDLAPGRFRMKAGGGAAGNNGVRSITARSAPTSAARAGHAIRATRTWSTATCSPTSTRPTRSGSNRCSPPWPTPRPSWRRRG